VIHYLTSFIEIDKGLAQEVARNGLVGWEELMLTSHENITPFTCTAGE
jgi:hypothetical protein